jgi:Mrp family chromosome partitioning ATPase
MSEMPKLSDAYTVLLGSLRLTAPLNSGKSIMITGTPSDDGKTTVASCLAIAASLIGQSVLLAGGDTRRPLLSSNAGGCNAAGLMEVLDGMADPSDAIRSAELRSYSREAATIGVITAGRGAWSCCRRLIGRGRAKCVKRSQGVSASFGGCAADPSGQPSLSA